MAVAHSDRSISLSRSLSLSFGGAIASLFLSFLLSFFIRRCRINLVEKRTAEATSRRFVAIVDAGVAYSRQIRPKHFTF